MSNYFRSAEIKARIGGGGFAALRTTIRDFITIGCDNQMKTIHCIARLRVAAWDDLVLRFEQRNV